MAWRAIPGPLSKRKRRLDSLEAAQGAQETRVACIDSSATLSVPSQLEGKIGLPRANPSQVAEPGLPSQQPNSRARFLNHGLPSPAFLSAGEEKSIAAPRHFRPSPQVWYL